MNFHIAFFVLYWYNLNYNGGRGMLDKLKINKKLLKQMDYSIIIIAVILVLFGTINIYSATRMLVGYNKLIKQLLWLGLGLVIVYIILTFDYYVIGNYAKFIYWISNAVLVYVLTTKAVNGATGWLFGGSIQPSELSKLAIILMLAKKIDDMEGNVNNFKNLVILLIYAAIPMVLILAQPDMGMTMICFFILLGILFMSGLNTKTIFIGLTVVAVLIAGIWNSGLIHSYQKARITAVIDQGTDVQGANYQVTQAKIGIGSGGIIGKGFLKGTQVAGNFVPFNSTDSIYSVVGEEWGLVGGAALLLLYGILLYKILHTSRNSKDIFGSVICVGIFSSLLFSIFQNIGMNIGILPISGITLPFMSYGGSSIVTNFISLGLVLNVGMRKKKINF